MTGTPSYCTCTVLGNLDTSLPITTHGVWGTSAAAKAILCRGRPPHPPPRRVLNPQCHAAHPITPRNYWTTCPLELCALWESEVSLPGPGVVQGVAVPHAPHLVFATEHRNQSKSGSRRLVRLLIYFRSWFRSLPL